MEQLSFFAVPSPCVGVCQSDSRGYCLGCLRSRDERFNWMSFSELQKQDVIRLCLQRKKRRQFTLHKARQQELLNQQMAHTPQLDFEDKQNSVDDVDLADFSLDD
ncbi:DUF1289 domain-containing protein [Shewanella inventionis]|uniref:DUF1289 domain-containing protein n=1 Tax=Shewanella inventionis TaxID=1738770 RepID=UPI001CBF675C|nr:DUF1289 domain-containing protein [Shewanella inventionis]UAL44624.1 DUF1289 domain-containing protein [Shewanella inventionis]